MRIYKVGKKNYPSVTSLLPSFKDEFVFKHYLKTTLNELDLTKDYTVKTLQDVIYSQVCNKFLLPLEIGNSVHKYIESYTNGCMDLDMLEKECEEVRIAVYNFMSFTNDIKSYKGLYAEKLIHHKELGYAGKVDLVARCGDSIVLIDVKTVNIDRYFKSSFNYNLQVAAYFYAWNSYMGQDSVDNAECLQITGRQKILTNLSELGLEKADKAAILYLAKNALEYKLQLVDCSLYFPIFEKYLEIYYLKNNIKRS